MIKLNFFNFRELNNQILLTNDFGCHMFLRKEEFKRLLAKDIDDGSDLYKKLLESKMIYEDSDLAFSSRNSFRLREMKGYMGEATSLHIFVVTTACNFNCVYCQANSGTHCPNRYMDAETAERAVDIALQSPAKHLAFEFQGGEPLLNFSIIQHIVHYAEEHKNGKRIDYNVVTNLSLLTNEMVDFFRLYRFGISTSIDGAQDLHDWNRPFKDGKGSFSAVTEAVSRVRESGLSIGAIETTTRQSLQYAPEIVQAYAELGFDNIFIRPLTPLGKARKNWKTIGYTPEEFLGFYKAALDQILLLNEKGICMRETHASIFLKKLSGINMNYMELRSPCGGGIGQIAYFADGRVFTCDEGRMLAEMGDPSFQLGDVFHDDYRSLIKRGTCRTVCASSVLETLPSCCDCAYQPYCGVCPVVNYAMYQDVIEREPHTYKCRIHTGILDCLFGFLQAGDSTVIQVLNEWCNY